MRFKDSVWKIPLVAGVFLSGACDPQGGEARLGESVQASEVTEAVSEEDISQMIGEPSTSALKASAPLRRPSPIPLAQRPLEGKELIRATVERIPSDRRVVVLATASRRSVSAESFRSPEGVVVESTVSSYSATVDSVLCGEGPEGPSITIKAVGDPDLHYVDRDVSLRLQKTYLLILEQGQDAYLAHSPLLVGHVVDASYNLFGTTWGEADIEELCNL